RGAIWASSVSLAFPSHVGGLVPVQLNVEPALRAPLLGPGPAALGAFVHRAWRVVHRVFLVLVDQAVVAAGAPSGMSRSVAALRACRVAVFVVFIHRSHPLGSPLRCRWPRRRS